MNDYLDQINVKGVLYTISGGAGSGITSGDVQEMLEEYTYDKETIDDKISSGGGSSSAVTVLSGDVITISGDVITISGDVIELSESLDKVSGDVVVLSGDVNALEGKIDALSGALDDKQDKLISGTNIKTINGQSLLGSGDIEISGGTGGKAIVAGRGIKVTSGATADTVAFDLPISAGTGDYSVAEGYQTVASGNRSHAEGEGSTASGYYSHAEGYDTMTSNIAEHASGQYNDSLSASTAATFGDSGNTLFSVGNGLERGSTHNALDIRQNGDIYIADTNASGEYYQKPMIKLQDALGQGGGITSGEVQTMINQSISGKADNADLVIVSGDVIALSGIVINNEEVVARALNDLNDKKTSSGDVVDIVSGYTYDKDEIDGKINDASTDILAVIPDIVSADTEDIKQNVAQLQLSAVTNAEYDSTNKVINFYNLTGGSVASIDTTDFIKDGMIDDVEIVTSGGTTYLKITFNTDAGLEEIDLDLSSIFDANNYYTKTEVNNIVSNKIQCLSEAEWAQTSGSTQSDVLYLIY